MTEIQQRRSVFFELRSVLSFIVLALLAFHHELVSPQLWLLGTGLLVSNLFIRFLPPGWLCNPVIGYVIFFLDMGGLTVVLYTVSGIQSESLLIYYLTVFMATLGEDLRKSMGIAIVAGVLYVGLHVSRGGAGNVLANPQALMHIPLFFVTAVSCGYLAQEVRARKQQVHMLKDIHRSLEVKIDKSLDDLSESERLRAAAQASEQRFVELVQSLDAIVWEADAGSLHFTFVSHRGEEVLGHPPERWRSVPDFCSRYVHPEDREGTLASWRGAVYAGRDHDFEFRGVAADGRLVWLRNIVRVIRNANGQAQRLRGVMVDITERRRAEEALRMSEEGYRVVAETATDAIITIDEDSTILFANPAAEKIFGHSVAEMVGQELTMLMPEHFRNLHKASLKRYLATGEKHISWRATQLPGLHKDGHQISVEISFGELIKNGKHTFSGVVRDITERKRLEEQLRQSQKMEAVGRLAGGVAHDFNNLLTIITGYGQLLQDRLGPEDPLRGYASEIKQAGDRAASLTRQLLAFSRQQVLAPQVLNLNVVVTNVEKMLRRLIGEDIELVTVPGPDLGLVKADPGQIEQVILNLAVNARDAMPRGGKLTIETANAELDESYAQTHFPVTPGHYVMLAVTDTGCGMDRETQTHIFEPFFTTKEKGKGTGLGLAMMYGIVKQSGGYIWVYSELGQGTTFKIYLPRTEEPIAVAGTAKTEGAAVRDSGTILLVEDDDAVRSFILGVLQSGGYTVLQASRGNEALEISRRHLEPIHLMVTDVVMPEISGPELAEHLATVHPEMKVLYMSGYTDDAIFRHGLLDPGMAFLQKPFTPEDLVRKVRESLIA